MAVLSLALVCDGTSDLCLSDLIVWMMDTHFPERTFRVIPAVDVIPARGNLAPRLRRTVQLYQPSILFCHRDAERASLNERTREIEAAAEGLDVPVVPVVPVRMLEAWLLFDEDAVRSAANNTVGRTPLELPPLTVVEGLPDPKDVLMAALMSACELPPRRRRAFNAQRARSRVTSYIADFSPLRRLAAFRQFEQKFLETLNAYI